MSEEKLHKHIHETYFHLRIGIASIAIVFPIFLLLGGWYYGIEHQDSMSDYYHAIADKRSMRDWFVGLWFAIGVFLFLYKGFSKRENYALNLAGILAIGVAIFLLQTNCVDCGVLTMHKISAISFFICLTYVCISCAPETLRILKDPVKVKNYRNIYRAMGLTMIVSPIIAFLLITFSTHYKYVTFYIELVGIWTFASYWILKSWELKGSEAEAIILRNNIEDSTV